MDKGELKLKMRRGGGIGAETIRFPYGIVTCLSVDIMVTKPPGSHMYMPFIRKNK